MAEGYESDSTYVPDRETESTRQRVPELRSRSCSESRTESNSESRSGSRPRAEELPFEGHEGPITPLLTEEDHNRQQSGANRSHIAPPFSFITDPSRPIPWASAGFSPWLAGAGPRAEQPQQKMSDDQRQPPPPDRTSNMTFTLQLMMQMQSDQQRRAEQEAQERRRWELERLRREDERQRREEERQTKEEEERQR